MKGCYADLVHVLHRSKAWCNVSADVLVWLQTLNSNSTLSLNQLEGLLSGGGLAAALAAAALSARSLAPGMAPGESVAVSRQPFTAAGQWLHSSCHLDIGVKGKEEQLAPDVRVVGNEWQLSP